MKDPHYIEDLDAFLKCSKCIQPREDEEDEFDSFEEMYWVVAKLHRILFKSYYKDNISITQLIVNLIKETKNNAYGQFALWEFRDTLHEYKCYKEFLSLWIKEQQIIEKNMLTQELELVNDVTKRMVENVVTQL
jgi:hypothetical protein